MSAKEVNINENTADAIRHQIALLNMNIISSIETEIQYGGRSVLVSLKLTTPDTRFLAKVLDDVSRIIRDIIPPIEKLHSWVLLAIYDKEIVDSRNSDIVA